MTNSPRISREVSRRSLLAVAAGGAVVLGVSVTAKRAEAAKMSQQVAAYQNTPKADQRCDACAHFQPPSSCHLVEGEISPPGWCKLFTKKPSGQ